MRQAICSAIITLLLGGEVLAQDIPAAVATPAEEVVTEKDHNAFMSSAVCDPKTDAAQLDEKEVPDNTEEGGCLWPHLKSTGLQAGCFHAFGSAEFLFWHV